ncbi:unnamed protein product, partial [Mesorhabditis belari]|uniref:DUF4440 domain-containing protein n=1 Tax=Mesorhabditis belari TaxID=2138241 RepID=A0AAF3EX47_9BILA
MAKLILVSLLITFTVAEIRTSISEVEKTLRPQLDAYKEAVYSKNFKKVVDFYHSSAVLVETGKAVYHTPEKIVDAIQKYYTETGVNVKAQSLIDSEEFSGGGKILSYSNKWTMHNSNEILKGPYFQIWVLNDENQWKIYHDEFSIAERISKTK